jgi:ankyrin repeat protein
MNAAIGGHGEIVSMLIDAGASMDLQEMVIHRCITSPITSSNYDASKQTGYTALMCAAASGDKEVVAMLVDSGANMDLQTKVLGSFPSLRAVVNPHMCYSLVTLLWVVIFLLLHR